MLWDVVIGSLCSRDSRGGCPYVDQWINCSFFAQRYHRLQLCGASGWDGAGEDRYNCQT